MKNGSYNTGYTGIMSYNNTNYYVKNGYMDPKFTGFVNDSYVQNGVVTGKYNGIVKDNKGTLYYVKNSKIDRTYSGVIKYTDGKYYAIEKGQNKGTAAKTVSSGTFSKNLSWKMLDCKTLVISGKGVMEDFVEADDTPWYGSRKQIETIFVEDGVTRIGAYAFADCVNLTTVTIANSVVYTNDTAFEGCSKLKK